MKSKICIMCGEPITGRRNKVFCSGRCTERNRREKLYGSPAAVKIKKFDPETEVCIQEVCETFNVPKRLLLSRSRYREVMIPRHILMLKLGEKGMSQERIAEVLNKRDRSVVSINSRKVLGWIRNKDSVFMSYYNKLKTA